MIEGLERVRAGEVELCVRDRGRGPAVVLLHGTTANLGVWDAVVDRLDDACGRRMRTLAVDQRGHGRSGKPAAGYHAADYCADTQALIEARCGGPVIVVGHSLGARNAVVLGADRPDLVAGVVAVDYTPYVEPDVLDELEERVRGGDRVFTSVAEVERYLHGRYPLLPRAAVRRRARYGYAPAVAGIRPLADPAAMVHTVNGLRHDFIAEMRGIAVPVTLLRGQLSRIISGEAFAATRELRPDLRALEVPRADHYLPEVAPDTVAAEVARMVDHLSTTIKE
ncbi:alpha/beta fold hydrolase [Spirillospora sp. CA-108201]